MDISNKTELIEYLLSVYGVFYSTPSIILQLLMCLVAIIFCLLFTVVVATTPVILLTNCVASYSMIVVHIIRSLVSVVPLPTDFATELVFYTSILHGTGDGLFTCTLLLLLIERNFVIRHHHAFERHKRRYHILIFCLIIIAVLLSVMFGLMIYLFSFDISASMGNIAILLLTAVAATYTYYDARRIYKIRKANHTLETRYRLSEGMELSRSIAPVCITCCALKIIGMAPLWIGQFHVAFLLFALWMYYIMNTVSVLVCAALLMWRNRALRKRLSILLHLKCISPPLDFNTDSSASTYFNMLAAHWG